MYEKKIMNEGTSLPTLKNLKNTKVPNFLTMN